MEKNTTIRPFKIIITGPESTGKSTLSKQLAKHFTASWVPEYAREYLNQLNRPYQESDLLKIAKGQLKKEQDALIHNPKILLIDTSLVVLKVWSEWKYKRCDPFILQNLHEQSVDLYLLTAPDLPWQDDQLRENPDDRELLFDIYEQELQKLGVKYHIVSGTGDERINSAISVVSEIVESLSS